MGGVGGAVPAQPLGRVSLGMLLGMLLSGSATQPTGTATPKGVGSGVSYGVCAVFAVVLLRGTRVYVSVFGTRFLFTV